MEKEPETAVVIDHGPADKWHPIYDTVEEFFRNEAKPAPPGTAQIRRRKRNRAPQ